MSAIGRVDNAPRAGRLTGRVAMVSGASTGIGAATAALFVAEGARVSVMARRAEPLEALAATLGRDDRAVAVAGDVSRAEDVERWVGATLERFGGVDVLVANAGIHRVVPFTELTDADWSEMLDTNLTGTFRACRAAARSMIEAGRPGSIVVTSSTNGLVAEPGMAHYNATKGGLNMLTRSMAVDLAPHGIRVNAVAPGTIESEITRPMIEQGFPFGEIPLGRVGRASEVAAAILFLASDEASYVTGEILVVDGGQIALNGAATETTLGVTGRAADRDG